MLKLEKAAQEGLFGFGEPRHRHSALPAAQGGAERDYQQLVEIMQSGIPGSRIFQPFPARGNLLQGTLQRRIHQTEGTSASGKRSVACQANSKCESPVAPGLRPDGVPE
jgi:hypothetical protein